MPPSPSVVLKSRACINCRRRKTKCDGDRPSCGKCARSNGAFDDCEYPGSGPTQTQLLENRISHLQSRIRQLEGKNEDPRAIASAIPLYHPYSKHDTSNDPPFRPSSERGSPTSSQSPSSPAPRTGSASLSAQEPPIDTRLNLIDVFYQYASRLGFFLDASRFHSSFLQPHRIGHHSRPTQSLLNAIYLWGAHLSEPPSSPSSTSSPSFLRKALYHLPRDLSSLHPHKIIHGIQAEVLLSYYYLMRGKVLGGHYHANAAVSLSLSSGLHRIRAADPVPPTSSTRPPLSTLPKPIDDTEEGERVDAFWAVLVLNNTWIAMQDSYSMFDDLQTMGVDTPWPMDSFEYQLQLLPSVSSGTIKGFLDSTNLEGFSTIALHAKAAVLLQQATVYASNPDEFEGGAAPVVSDSDESRTLAGTEFSRIEAVIEQFKSHLLLVSHTDEDIKPSKADTLVMIQMMTHAALIKLHLPFIEKDPCSRQKSLSAARAIAVLTHGLPPSTSIRIDPIVGVLWTTACDVFILELNRADSIATGNNTQWSTLLHSIFSQMEKFSLNNPFMKFLVVRLQKNSVVW